MLLPQPPLIAFFLALWTTYALCSPFSITNSTTNKLERRQCVFDTKTQQWVCDDYLPSLNQIMTAMKDPNHNTRAVPQNPSVFYTNLVDMHDQTKRGNMMMWIWAYFQSQGLEHTSWFSSFNVNDGVYIDAQEFYVRNFPAGFMARYGKTAEEINKLWDYCSSQAIAYVATHPEAYIFTKTGVAWLPTSVWQQAELWVLTREDGPVQRIYQVDPRPPSEGGPACPVRNLIWERGTHPSFPKGWECPIDVDHEPTIP